MTLIVEYVKNAEILEADGSKVKAIIKYKNLPERETILSVDSDDKEEVELLYEITEGKYGEVTPHIVNISAEEAQAGFVIAKRNKLLLQSDWTQLGDIPAATKEKWTAYRQALRDITKQEGFPFTVTFPEQP
jgi:hypothetical protein